MIRVVGLHPLAMASEQHLTWELAELPQTAGRHAAKEFRPLSPQL
jgi:hypothetical protein